MKSRLSRGGLVALALSAAMPSWAHHSVSGEFDINKHITFTGTVQKVEWTNPHVYTHVEVKQPDGTTVVYRIEGGAPNALFRQGWRKETLKLGDTVTVQGCRSKNPASTNIGMATLTAADGRTIYSDRSLDTSGGSTL
jgi:DNA/RNA endonuclease YhcR with UshA esterase domain